VNPNQQIQVIDTKWHIEEFRLFQPNLAIDDYNPAGDMISVGQDTIYRKVDAFCECIVESARDKGAEIVRDNLHLCLCDATSRWWTFEVPDVDKRTIKSDRSETLDE